VAASCAIPGFYCSVEISGRRYIDGGVYSPSNLDVLRTEPLDLVVALNPMSSLATSPARNLGERLAARVREGNGRRLGHEAKRLRAAGIEVQLLQPNDRDLAVMGGNLMSSKRRHEMIETAIETTTQQLRDSSLGERLATLPQGDPRLVRRPSGPPSTWPDFRAAARERWVTLQAA
jgi:NTE family protein